MLHLTTTFSLVVVICIHEGGLLVSTLQGEHLVAEVFSVTKLGIFF